MRAATERPALWVHTTRYLGGGGHGDSLGLGERSETVGGEALGEQRQVLVDLRCGGEQVVGLVEEPFDGLHAEHAVEAGGQAGGCAAEHAEVVFVAHGVVVSG